MKVHCDFKWGINIFHPFSIADMHAVGEYEPQTRSVLIENHLAWARFKIKWRDLMPPISGATFHRKTTRSGPPYDAMISGLAENARLFAIAACGQLDMV